MKKIDKKRIKEREKELLAFNPNYFEPLDDEERQLQKDLNNELYVEMKGKRAILEKKRISKTFEEYFKKNRKNKSVTMRIDEDIVNKIKLIATDVGLNYQSYLNVILHQIASEKIKVEIKTT
jgi:predicted DNA binding CopG/RHH family protein